MALIAAIFFIEPANLTPTSSNSNSGSVSLLSPFRSTGGSNNQRQTTVSKPASSLSEIEKQLKEVEGRTEDLQEEIAELERKEKISKYSGLIEIKKLNTTSSSNPSNEYVRLYASRKISEPVNISGWKLVSLRDNSQMTIPQGTSLYRPNGRSHVSNILLDGNENIYINSGKSPISTSFKTNICSGYHEQFNNFNPRISLRCPYPDQNIIGVPDTIQNEVCLDYIDRMPRCKVHVGAVPSNLGNDCNAYVGQKVNYPTCIETYKNYEGFYREEWRVFLDRSKPLWKKKKERLQLIDHEGKVVDEYRN